MAMGIWSELLTPAQAAAVAEVPLKAVYKTVAERLPKGALIRRAGQTYLTPEALVCIRLDYELPKDVPIKVRRFVYGKLGHGSSGRLEYGTPLFSYVVDPGPTSKKMAARLRSYQKAMQLVVEDPEIQGGAATFKGTRILVHQIVGLLRQGISEAELREDYPKLTSEMIDAARIYSQAHPRRGRPHKPTWRASKPLSTKIVRRRRA